MPITASQFKQAGQFAVNYGVKAVVYGPPGSGKTPLINSAPRPILFVCEPGLRSMARSTIPAMEVYSPDNLRDMKNWIVGSNETKNFDTIALDSVSQMSEIFLAEGHLKNKDGRAAYGYAADQTSAITEMLFFLKNKHIVLIAKQEIYDDAGVFKKRPYFPGKVLNVEIPHRYDLIMHYAADKIMVPGLSTPVKALRTASSYDIMARDRSGMLNEFEPPDLNAIFAKSMS